MRRSGGESGFGGLDGGRGNGRVVLVVGTGVGIGRFFLSVFIYRTHPTRSTGKTRLAGRIRCRRPEGLSSRLFPWREVLVTDEGAGAGSLGGGGAGGHVVVVDDGKIDAVVVMAIWEGDEVEVVVVNYA